MTPMNADKTIDRIIIDDDDLEKDQVENDI